MVTQNWHKKDRRNSEHVINYGRLKITPNQNHKQTTFTIAMATDTQNSSSPNIFTNLGTPKNDTKTEQGNQQIYDGYGHW